MDSKHIYFNRHSETNLRTASINRDAKAQRRMGFHGFHFLDNIRIHYNKMGEVTKHIVNIFGLMGLFFSFLANLNIHPAISVLIGAVSLAWAVFKALRMLEDWLIRRAERKEKEFDVHNKINGKLKL